jgi:hypothetical protein
VVTYLGRFETYFKPLIKRLHFLFPDYDIIVWINGHHDQIKQISYLNEITAFLKKFTNIRYITHYEHQPLPNGFNWLILMAESDKILILNDDIFLRYDFRYNFERLFPLPKICTFNGTWSHFFINKKIVGAAGWFDERLRGIGYEDTDYAIRLARKGIALQDIRIPGLYNLMAPPVDASWAQISDITLGKYSQINQDFFLRKWGIPYNEPVSEPDFIKINAVGHEWLIRPDPDLVEVPEFYPLSCLGNPEAALPRLLDGRIWVGAILARIVSYGSSFYWESRQTLVSWLRRLSGRHWEKWRDALINRRNNN